MLSNLPNVLLVLTNIFNNCNIATTEKEGIISFLLFFYFSCDIFLLHTLITYSHQMKFHLRRLFSSSCFVLLFSYYSFSQTNNNHYHTDGGTILSSGNSGTGSNIDVIYTRCNWAADPNDATKTLNGSVTTYFKTIVTNVGSITFDFNNASFNNAQLNVQYHGTACVANFLSSANIITITLPNTLATAGTIDSITINYSGIPPAASGAAAGYQRDVDAAGNNYIYTLSESYEDKDWWPCKADMQDKIDSLDINVTVPNSFWVAANGAMIDSADDGTNRTFKFKHRYPIASYLVAMAIGKYDKYYLGTVNTGTKNVPFVVNMFKGKSTATLTKILTSLNNNKLVLAAFSNLFGEYAFANEKHGYYEFGFGGGMEHQTMSGIGGGLLQSNTVLAHELAHQWWGDKVTMATWNHLWLAEGFATYGEALAFEFVPSIGIDPILKMLNNKTTARGNNSTPILISNITNSNTVWTNNNTTAIYERGCIVASMLRCLLGDTKYFTACKNYLQDPQLAYKSATTANLQTHMQTQFGEDLTNFFTEWITKKGTPDYAVEWANIGNKINIKLTQTIAATGSTGVASTFFPMPVVVKIADASGTVDTTITMYHKAINQIAYTNNGVGATVNSNLISYNLSFVPATITFDPLNRTMANATITYNSALPIYKIDIAATTLANENQISASITTSNNIQKVELEKSIDGVSFEYIGKMNNTYSSAETYTYQAFDKMMDIEKIYYRAKVYVDGVATFSKVISINKKTKSTFSISPNVAKNFIRIVSNNKLNNVVITYQIVSGNGIVIEKLTSTNQLTCYNTQALKQGIYFVQQIENNAVVATEKFVISK